MEFILKKKWCSIVKATLRLLEKRSIPFIVWTAIAIISRMNILLALSAFGVMGENMRNIYVVDLGITFSPTTKIIQLWIERVVKVLIQNLTRCNFSCQHPTLRNFFTQHLIFKQDSRLNHAFWKCTQQAKCIVFIGYKESERDFYDEKNFLESDFSKKFHIKKWRVVKNLTQNLTLCKFFNSELDKLYKL